MQSNSDTAGLSHFVLTRLLACPDIEARFAHPTVPHLFHQGRCQGGGQVTSLVCQHAAQTIERKLAVVSLSGDVGQTNERCSGLL